MIIVEGTAADERMRPARREEEAGVAHLGERGTSGLDPGDQSGRRSGTAATSVARETWCDTIAQKREKSVGEGWVEGGDGRGMEEAIAPSGGMDRGRDGARAAGFELTALSGGGAQRGREEKEMHAARGALGEGGNCSAEAGAPAEVRALIVPIGDDQTGRIAKKDAKIGVGVEEPLAGVSNVGDVGFVRAKAGLEVLGAGLERQERDAEAKPPAGAAETGQAESSV